MIASMADKDITNNPNTEMILSARIYEYQKSLILDTIPKPRVTRGEQVLLKVGGSRIMPQRSSPYKRRMERCNSSSATYYSRT